MAKFLIGTKAEQLITKLAGQDFTPESVKLAVKRHDLENQVVEGIHMDYYCGGSLYCVFACYANNGDCFCENFDDYKDALKWLLET